MNTFYIDNNQYKLTHIHHYILDTLSVVRNNNLRIDTNTYNIIVFCTLRSKRHHPVNIPEKKMILFRAVVTNHIMNNMSNTQVGDPFHDISIYARNLFSFNQVTDLRDECDCVVYTGCTMLQQITTKSKSGTVILNVGDEYYQISVDLSHDLHYHIETSDGDEISKFPLSLWFENQIQPSFRLKKKRTSLRWPSNIKNKQDLSSPRYRWLCDEIVEALLELATQLHMSASVSFDHHTTDRPIRFTVPIEHKHSVEEELKSVKVAEGFLHPLEAIEIIAKVDEDTLHKNLTIKF